MDFSLWVKPHRGIGAPCGHLSSYFQSPEALSQKSTPRGLSHPHHHVVCIYLFFSSRSLRAGKWGFFSPPMSSCCALSLEVCLSAGNTTDTAMPSLRAFPLLYIVSIEGHTATWEIGGILIYGLEMQESMGAHWAPTSHPFLHHIWRICASVPSFSALSQHPPHDSTVSDKILRRLSVEQMYVK